MESYSYFLTDIAIEDIDEALGYITNELCNFNAAKKLFSNINSVIDRICDNPFMYEDCSEFFIENSNIRKSVIRNYILVYEIIEDKHQINILRFFYHRRNILG